MDYFTKSMKRSKEELLKLKRLERITLKSSHQEKDTTWMSQRDIVLDEISHSQKAKYYMIPLR